MGSSKALRIGVDVDDVVADLLTPWLNRYNKENGTLWTPEDLTQWSMRANLGCKSNDIYKHLTEDIYDNEVKPIPGTLEACEEIESLGHTVVFVTNCHTLGVFPRKQAWLVRNGFGAYEAIPTGGEWTRLSKNEANIDWLVDDHIGNLETFTRGYPVLVTRPHNRNLLWNGKRIKHLRDIIPLLKFEKLHDLAASAQAKGFLPIIRQFETGATRDTDTDKLDYEGFLSPIVLKRFAEYMHKHRHQSDGSLRASDNWQKGIPVDAYMKSLTRHFMDIWLAHRTGQPFPQEEACAMLFNVQGLLFEDLKAKTPVSSGSTD